MNARNHCFSINVEESCTDEVILTLFHTLLFHRSTGKFRYKGEENYSIGSLGFEDTDCRNLDVTYVRSSSPGLDKMLRD